MTRLAVVPVLLLAACTAKPPTPQDDLDRRFTSMMNGVTLSGGATVNGRTLTGEDKYVIDSARKLTAETWLLTSRIGSHNLPIPVPVTIKWAGDTPVITLTDLAIPGVGTYTARVVLYGDQYAGTWSGKNVSGQIYGKIIRNSAAPR